MTSNNLLRLVSKISYDNGVAVELYMLTNDGPFNERGHIVHDNACAS